MHFEREFPTYAEPVSQGKFKEGEVYFSVQYVDKEMLIPVVETLVCLGKDTTGTNENRLHFQDVESYRRGIRRKAASANVGNFQSIVDGKAKHIFEYEKALDELLRCALRRQKPEK